MGIKIYNPDAQFGIRIAESGMGHVTAVSGDVRQAQLLVAVPMALNLSLHIGNAPRNKPDQNIKIIHCLVMNAVTSQ
jgi:hypothetical protein